LKEEFVLKTIGYDRPLFVQPFDHRGSFTKGFFGLPGAPEIGPPADQHSPVSFAKGIVYRGLLRAIELGVPKEMVGILVDSQFGSHILADAKGRGIPTSVCVEKTGQKIFDFEYGPGWAHHVRHVGPDIIKVLVRFNPHDDVAAKFEQMTRLMVLSDYIHAGNDHVFMFELLVPAVTEEQKAAGAAYDSEIRPGLMIEAIRELQDFGIEPDIWKIEGLDKRQDAEAVAAQVRNSEARAKAACILLGRGSDTASVHRWLQVAAPVPGFIGFAVGRTNFSLPLKRYIDDPSAENEASAIEEIGGNFKGCVDVWRQAQG
jgi:5-dehydro-2-deoxygluconokinase